MRQARAVSAGLRQADAGLAMRLLISQRGFGSTDVSLCGWDASNAFFVI